jgi:hypothetical protein
LRLTLHSVSERTVHGRPAIVTDDLATALDAPDSQRVVIWWEQGRLIALTATGTDDQLVAMAETVRPATPAEWAEVTSAAQRAAS